MKIAIEPLLNFLNSEAFNSGLTQFVVTVSEQEVSFGNDIFAGDAWL